MSRLNQENLMGNVMAKEINLKEYYVLIKKRLWILIVITTLTTAVGYYFSHMNNVPLYQTSTRIIMGPGGNMTTLMVMIKDPIIMDLVKEELQLPQSAGAIANQIEVAQIDESQVVRISVTGTDPAEVADIANTTASVYKSEIANILDFNEVQLLSEAAVNGAPINEVTNRNVIIAFFFGLIVSIGLVFLLDSLDGSVKRERDVEEVLGVPVLGVVSNMNRKKLLNKRQTQPEIELRGETVNAK